MTTSQEMGLLEAPDDRQVAFAVAENRVLVTHDEDFLALAKAGVLHTGIAYCHPQLRSIGQIHCDTAIDSRLHDVGRNAEPY